jgi:DNA-binding GntR family transcriptional regulator
MRASDRAYAALREDILGGQLVPGTALGEVEQSERLGVSRTPLREALARLAADGLVTGDAGRGMAVTELSPASVVDLFELRQALECHAAALAARRRDRAVFDALHERFLDTPRMIAEGGSGLTDYYGLVADFDSAVDAAIGNSYLVASLTSIRTHLARIRRIAKDNPDRLRAAADEHTLIVRAIADGDAVLAEAATEVHLRRSLDTILATLDPAGPLQTHRRTAA